MLYEAFIKDVLCVDELDFCSKEQIDGAKAISMMCLYLDGCNPKLMEFSKALECDPSELEEVYVNMTVNGAWSKDKDLRNDQVLLSAGNPKVAPKNLSKDTLLMKQRTAWSFIAGWGQGLTHQGYSRFPSYNK